MRGKNARMPQLALCSQTPLRVEESRNEAEKGNRVPKLKVAAARDRKVTIAGINNSAKPNHISKKGFVLYIHLCKGQIKSTFLSFS